MTEKITLADKISDNAKLIARLEAASEGSRELDVALWDAIEQFQLGTNGLDWRIVNRHGAEQHVTCAPDYTESIDTAVMLVPEGWFWELYSAKPITGSKWPAQAVIHRRPGVGAPEHKSTGATPALALCCAALKAREAA